MYHVDWIVFQKRKRRIRRQRKWKQTLPVWLNAIKSKDFHCKFVQFWTERIEINEEMIKMDTNCVRNNRRLKRQPIDYSWCDFRRWADSIRKIRLTTESWSRVIFLFFFTSISSSRILSLFHSVLNAQKDSNFGLFLSSHFSKDITVHRSNNFIWILIRFIDKFYRLYSIDNLPQQI